MTPADLRQKFSPREEGRSSLHALLKPPSFIYAASRAEKPRKLAKFAPSSETWVRTAGRMGGLTCWLAADQALRVVASARRVLIQRWLSLVTFSRIRPKMIVFTLEYREPS